MKPSARSSCSTFAAVFPARSRGTVTGWTVGVVEVVVVARVALVAVDGATRLGRGAGQRPHLRCHPTADELIAQTPADGLVMGLAQINGDRFGPDRSRCARCPTRTSAGRCW